MAGQPSQEDWVMGLTSTSGLGLPDFGLAIPTGTEDANGYEILDAGSLAGWNLDLIIRYGRSVVAKMVSDMCNNQSEVQLCPDDGGITPTIAAFCNRYTTPNAANNTVGVIVAKDTIAPQYHWLAELGIAQNSSEFDIGKHHYTSHSGPVVWGYIVQFGLDPYEGRVYRIKVKQIPVAQLVSEMLTMFLQADLLNQFETLPHGNVVQNPTDSSLLGVGAADFIQYAMSFLCKRYSQYNAIWAGSPMPQSDFYLAGGSDQTYMPLDALNFSFPTQIVEDLARLVTFELPSRNLKYVDVRLPVLVGYVGRDFNANPLDVSGPSISVSSALTQMYPNVTWPNWVFGASYTSLYPLTLAATTYAKFIGSTPSASRRQIGSDLAWFNQFFPLTAVNANVEELDETLLYYTVVCTPHSSQTLTFDLTMTLQCHSMVNKYAFDPRHTLQDIRTMPIAVFPLEFISDYTSSYDEVKSLDMETDLATISMLIENTVNNKYSGFSSEQAESTKSSIVQGLGGGFLLKLGRIAGRVWKAAPSIFSAIQGAFGGDGEMVPKSYVHQVCKAAIKLSSKYPHSGFLRIKPIDGLGSSVSGLRIRA
jgi:hypothetical protein